ncbi:hypothetical protein D3C75_890630 [compost metagenome]
MNHLIRTLIDDARIILTSLQDTEAAFAQRFILLAQGDHHPVEVIQLPILTFFIPFHALAAVRVFVASKSNFITIINAGCSHKSKKKYNGQLKSPLVFTHDRQEPGGIMAAQQIEDHFIRLLRITHKEGSDPVAEGNAVHASVEEFQYGSGKGIIHHRIELVPQQPG